MNNIDRKVIIDMDDLRNPIGRDDENLITWIFEDGTFVLAAKLTKNEQYTIVTDYLGTPVQMYNQNAEKTWDCTLDIYGKVRIFEGSSLSDCLWRYQGQYEDEETGLYYNRFRYYSPEIGGYLSQDPIGLAGGNPTLYWYVTDINLSCQLKRINSNFCSLAQLRASVITHWIKSYGLRKAQYLAGHKSIVSTEEYLPNYIEDLADDMTKFNPF